MTFVFDNKKARKRQLLCVEKSLMDITPSLCRAARALLDWTQADLAEAVGLAPETITRFERGGRPPHPNNLVAIREALEAAGIEFLPETKTKGPGLRVRK